MVQATAQRNDRKKSSPLATPTDLKHSGVEASLRRPASTAGRRLRPYVKTKNFHWHMSGPHFRDYHLLLDEHADQIFAMTDDIAERARKIGGTTLHSIGEIAKHQTLEDNNDEFVAPQDMLAELRDDNQRLTKSLREVHKVCDDANDVATASLIENWIDQTERRTWFLFEATRDT